MKKTIYLVEAAYDWRDGTTKMNELREIAEVQWATTTRKEAIEDIKKLIKEEKFQRTQRYYKIYYFLKTCSLYGKTKVVI